MANGKQLSDHNLQLFNSWLSGKTDKDLVQLVFRGVLSRKEIAEECGFSKSVLDQNPRVTSALKSLEENLRERGILPQIIVRAASTDTQPLMRDAGNTRHSADAERLRRVELENASLKAELSELKSQLSQFTNLQQALVLTGRLPR